MLRKITSTTLFVSLIALASSGIMMLVINGFGFQLRMHPVHKIFGILMILCGCLHIYYNFTSVKKYLKSKSILLYTVGMILFMFLLYFAGYKKPLDQNIIKEIDVKTMQLESKAQSK